MPSLNELEQQYYAAMLNLDDVPPYPSLLDMKRAFLMGVISGEITFGGEVSPQDIAAAVEDYLTTNPPAQKGLDIPVDADSEHLRYITINDDGTATAGWPDRERITYNPQSGADTTPQWTNEYGERRGMPARPNTVGFRYFVATDASGVVARDNDVPVLELADDRTNRNRLWAVMPDGTVITRGVETAPVMVVPAGTAVPAGTPDGTLFVEYTP